MRSLIPFLAICILPLSLFGQEKPKKEKKKKDSIILGWKSKGMLEVLFNQSAFNEEWQGGGTSNIAGSFNLSQDLNYKSKKISWDTRLIANLGLAIAKDQEFVRKTTDRFEINSIFGDKIPETNFYYSGIVNFRTQLASGFEFFNREVRDEEGEIVEVVQDRRKITASFSPAYLQAGPGILWKESDDFKINLAPATIRYIFVSSRFTRVDENDPEALENYVPYFGVEANESFRFEFGASLSVYYKEELFKNIVFENSLNLYADYLENTKNVDLDYTLTINMNVNRYITTNIALQLIYDENAVSGLQVRQVLGLGVTYSFLDWKSQS
ncbi:DUF3078 domain-containing protein [uncultured Dokdonia sp.]|uniref:DUF3078 domain-containing protein n=1 Tax=uncultured Dokdonia sp. TaxID=575653 RepID=UPI0026208900|nr:DUF3078 domain-containing protein [uncultured Dokdonia sp.]